MDVDGVLNHKDCPNWEKDLHLTLDADCIERMKRVCDETEARIVVSSTWRSSQNGMGLLLKHFQNRIIGVTPHVITNSIKSIERCKEIEAWLHQHSAIPMDIVVIDDDNDAKIPFFPFIQTSFEDGGFTEENVRSVIDHFNRTDSIIVL